MTTSESATTISLDQETIFGSFLSGVVLTFGTRLLMLAGVFGSGVIIARWLGPDGFGAYAVVNVTVALALQIGSAGLPSANTYFIARDRHTVGPVWANAIAFALVIGILLTAGVLALGWLRPSMFGGVSTRLLAIAAISIPFQLLFILNLNVLLALNRIRQLNLFDGLLPALVLANAVMALVLLHQQLTFLVALNTVVGSALSLVLMIYLRRVIADKRDSRPLRPDANSAATRLPADVPTTRSGAKPFSSSAWITPMWAKPRAAPPPSARPMRGRRGGGGGAGGGGAAATGEGEDTGGGALAQPARPRPPRAARRASHSRRCRVFSLCRMGIPV